MTTTTVWNVVQLERHTADDAEEFTAALAAGLLTDIYSLT